MAILAGEIVSAARLNRMQPVPYRAAASADLTLTTSQQDVTGASITLTTSAANAIYVAEVSADTKITTGAAATIQVRLVVDGVAESAEGLYYGGTTSERATVSQQWRGTLASAGSHTLKIAALKSANVGTMLVDSTHTVLVVTIYEVV